MSFDFKYILEEYPAESIRLMPGNCLVRIERKANKEGSFFVPDTVRDLSLAHRDLAYFGTVLAMSPRRDDKTGRRQREDFGVGDRIWLMLLEEDLGKDVVLTKNTRVYAEINCLRRTAWDTPLPSMGKGH